jgi:hypothetical protein
MKIKNLNEIEVKKWIKFCDNNNNAWIEHRGITFIKENNYSFCVLSGEEIIAICPFIIEKIKYEKKYNVSTMFGMSHPSPVLADHITGKKQIKKLKKLIYSNIDKLALNHNISKVTLNFLPTLYNKNSLTDIVNELNYHDYLVDVNSKIILLDLNIDIKDQWSMLSKGHRSEIKKHIDTVTLKYKSSKNMSKTFKDFKLSIKPIIELPDRKESFLFELYKIDLVDFIYVNQGDNILGGGIFLKYGGISQYLHSKRFLKNDLPIHHLLLWLTIKKYKEQNQKILDLGVFSYNTHQRYILTDKKKNIALFKRGFGGDIKAFPIGEKYFSKDYFKDELSIRKSNYIEKISI